MEKRYEYRVDFTSRVADFRVGRTTQLGLSPLRLWAFGRTWIHFPTPAGSGSYGSAVKVQVEEEWDVH